MRQELLGAPTTTTLSNVIDKWEHAERIVTRRSWGKIPHWGAHCEVPHFASLLALNVSAWPLFDDNFVIVNDQGISGAEINGNFLG